MNKFIDVRIGISMELKKNKNNLKQITALIQYPGFKIEVQH